MAKITTNFTLTEIAEIVLARKGKRSVTFHVGAKMFGMSVWDRLGKEVVLRSYYYGKQKCIIRYINDLYKIEEKGDDTGSLMYLIEVEGKRM